MLHPRAASTLCRTQISPDFSISLFPHSLCWNQIFWDSPYKGPAELIIADGDKLTFAWNTKSASKKNDVFQVTSAANFKNCVTNNKTGKSQTKQIPAGTFTTQALTPGTKYYTSTVAGRCSSKQKVKVNVVSALAR